MLNFLLIGLCFFSCQGQKQNSETEIKNRKIHLNDLNEKHPNKLQMENFINNYNEEFIVCKQETEPLKYQSLIQKQYCFKTNDSDLSIILIFCESQKDALTVAEANFVSDNTNQKYCINGATLVIVSGKDNHAVNSVLSYFAGEE